jgi:hypothetical protein
MVKDGRAELLEQVVIGGDLSKLSAADRVAYYRTVCESIGLNPFTKPFDYLMLNGKLVLYAKRDATDQLRTIRGISVTTLGSQVLDEIYVVTACGTDRTGRTDSATGAVAIAGLKGEAKANAMMKAETKAKRRLTLSLAGLGWLDEVEVESVTGAQRVDVDTETGEIVVPPKPRTLADAVAATEPRLGSDSATVAPGLSGDALAAWLAENRVENDVAQATAKALFPNHPRNERLSDAQRLLLRDELAKSLADEQTVADLPF